MNSTKYFISESDILSTFRFLYREFTQTDRFTEVGVFCLFKGKAVFLLVTDTFLKVLRHISNPSIIHTSIKLSVGVRLHK